MSLATIINSKKYRKKVSLMCRTNANDDVGNTLCLNASQCNFNLKYILWFQNSVGHIIIAIP